MMTFYCMFHCTLDFIFLFESFDLFFIVMFVGQTASFSVENLTFSSIQIFEHCICDLMRFYLCEHCSLSSIVHRRIMYSLIVFCTHDSVDYDGLFLVCGFWFVIDLINTYFWKFS